MKNKNIFLTIGIVIFGLIIVLGLIFLQDTGSENLSEQQIEEETDSSDQLAKEIVEDNSAKGEQINENDNIDESMDDTDGNGRYIDYNSSQLTDDTNILFFHAGWCPTCGILDKDINESISDIPSDVTIYKVNYDQELDLRKDYDVTYQHTLVLVDSEGNLEKKWTNSLSLESLLSEL